MARYDAPIWVRSRSRLTAATGMYTPAGGAAPVWSLPPSPINLNEGSSLDCRAICASIYTMLFTVDATSASVTGTGLSLNSNGVLTVAGNALPVTTSGIVIRADDQHGGITLSAAFSIHVIAVGAPTWSGVPVNFNNTQGSGRDVGVLCTSPQGFPLTFTLASGSLAGSGGITVSSAGVFTIPVGADVEVTGNLSLLANDGQGGTTQSPIFSLTVQALVTGPFFLFSEQRGISNVPSASVSPYTPGAYGAISGNSKHTGMGKIGSRWYVLAGDRGGIDPDAENDAPGQSFYSAKQGGRQEVMSFDPFDDYSHRIETRYFMRASESALQGWNYDDGFAAARTGHGEVYAWRAAGVLPAIIQPNGANGPYATLVNKPMAFVPGATPGTGHWSDPGGSFVGSNGNWNSNWRAFYYAALDYFLVPANNNGILIQRCSDWTDISCRSSTGALRGLVFPGDVIGAYNFAFTPGFIRGAKLYMLMQRSQDATSQLIEIDLPILFAWAAGTVNAAQPAGLITVIGTTPEKGAIQTQMDLDTANDVIVFRGASYTWIRAFTGSVSVWQQFPLHYAGHVGYDASSTVTVLSAPGVNGAWSTANGSVGVDHFGPANFRVNITGSFVATVWLQKDTAGDGVYIDQQSWTAPVSKVVFAGGDARDSWRLGVKSGGWTSGAVTAFLDCEKVWAVTRHFWDADYGGMLAISVSGGGTLPLVESRDENSMYVLKTGVLPSWIPAPGQLKAINIQSGVGSTISSVDICPQGGCVAMGGGNVSTFGGGIFNPWWGTHGGMVAHGGGDGDWFANPVLVYDNGLRKWVLAVRNTSVQFDYQQTKETQAALGLFDLTWGEWADGSPQSIHSYDQMDILPPYAGGGAQGSLVRSNFVGYRAAGFFSMHRANLATGVWSRASTTAVQGTNTYGGNLTGPSLVWVPPLQGFVQLSQNGGDYNYVVVLDYKYPMVANGNGAGVLRRQTIGANYHGDYLGTTVYWPKWKMLVSFGGAGVQLFDVMHFAVNAVASDHNFAAPFRPPIGGDALTAIPTANWGFCYDQKRDVFWIYNWQIGQRQIIYKLTPPEFDIKTQPWVITRITLPSTAPDGVDLNALETDSSQRVMSRRLCYVPQTDCVQWWLSVSGNVYAYRPN